MHAEKRVLFTWELADKARRKRWFYVKLQRLLTELPRRNWKKVGGSVYLVDDNCSSEFREHLKQFEGPELRWYEFRVECPPDDIRGMHGRALGALNLVRS